MVVGVMLLFVLDFRFGVGEGGKVGLLEVCVGFEVLFFI